MCCLIASAKLLSPMPVSSTSVRPIVIEYIKKFPGGPELFQTGFDCSRTCVCVPRVCVTCAPCLTSLPLLLVRFVVCGQMDPNADEVPVTKLQADNQ